jgi:long-chain acyl-CoA synthetase
MPDPTDCQTSIEALPVPALLDRAVQRFGTHSALDFLGRRYSYAELGRLVDGAAAGFQALGVKPGVKVGICLPNIPYFPICYYAILKAGGTVVNFNPLYVEPEIRQQINDSKTTIMVTLDIKLLYPKIAAQLGSSCLETIVVCPMAGCLPMPKRMLFRAFKRADLSPIPVNAAHVRFADLIARNDKPTPVEIDPLTAVAVLQYTGGTTGVPKGVMLTHANLTANVEQLRRWIPGITPGQERMMGVLPFFHVFAMTVVMNLGLAVGAELILLPRFDIKDVMKLIGIRKPTMFPAVPTIYAAINNATRTGSFDISSIKWCISGGAPLPQEIRAHFEEQTGCTLVEGYGLSEVAPVATCNPFGGPIKTGSVGLPLAGTEIEIRSLDDANMVVPTGELGEICVAGPQRMAGYWERPADTASVTVGRFLRTGDTGYLDQDGYLFVVDRIKDVIVCGGYNVYPRMIEEALYKHEDVIEGIAIGIPDDYRGQAPKVFVKLREGSTTTPDDLKKFLSTLLNPISLPRHIELRDKLPRTMIGKLSKKELVAEERAKYEASRAVTRDAS